MLCVWRKLNITIGKWLSIQRETVQTEKRTGSRALWITKSNPCNKINMLRQGHHIVYWWGRRRRVKQSGCFFWKTCHQAKFLYKLPDIYFFLLFLRIKSHVTWIRALLDVREKRNNTVISLSQGQSLNHALTRV